MRSGEHENIFKNMRGRCAEDLLNDMLILKLCGPQTAEAACGTFTQQCAELWSKHMGNHSLHTRPRAPRQPAAPRRKTKRETFAEARRAVLRASVRAKTQERDNEKTAFGVRADLFKPPLDEACGDSAMWNEGLEKFDKLSKSYKVLNNRLSKFGRAAFPKFTVRDSAKQRMLPDYSRITLLAFLPKHDEAASGAISAGYETRTGTHACKTADMVILDEFDRLHEEKADQAWVLHLLYIVARGLPVTTAAVALSLRGDMRKNTSSDKRSRTRTSDAKTDSFLSHKGIES